MRRVLLVAALLPGCAALQDRERPGVDVTVTVDFGRDMGQNFGTLFEAHDEDGRLAFGAGFAGVFNTRHRGERYKVQFFIRPRQDTGAYTMAQLPRYTEDTGLYAYGLGDAVYARSNGKDHGRPRQLAKGGTSWEEVVPEEDPGLACAVVRGKTLAWADGRLVYDGQVILDRPEHGSRFLPYYGQGHVYFYHRVDPGKEGVRSFNSVVAVPWSPYQEDLRIDMSRAKVLEITSVKEFPYGWGQLGKDVLNCSNCGGLYAFDGDTWRVLVKPDMKTSYQIYSMINHHDRLYMAQYPSGVLFEYDGEKVTTLTNWPPVMSGASTSAREAQTTQIYRGELLVGVWPWAELWRRDPDTQDWVFMQRMFTHPPVHARPVHAYEKEAQAAGLVLNALGHRLTTMVPHRSKLVIGTSSKAGGAIEADKLAFMTPQQRSEYGTVHVMHMPGNLAAVMAWKDKPVTLRFVARDGRMAIYQDGVELAAADVPPSLLTGLDGAKVDAGTGVYGPLRARVESIDVK